MNGDDEPPRTVAFLHGIGVGPNSWDAQVAALPAGMVGYAPAIAGLSEDSNFSLGAAAAELRNGLVERGVASAHLCGLSLGAMVATRFAIDFPECTKSLVLSGGQVRPNPMLMGVQNAIMRVLPARLVTAPGMTKQGLLAVLGAVAKVDFRAELSQIKAPTLVLCGGKDRANLPAARELAAQIPRADLQIVPDAGHEWNQTHPEEFSRRLNAFLAACEA